LAQQGQAEAQGKPLFLLTLARPSLHDGAGRQLMLESIDRNQVE
jgi:hypothetical protein